MRWQNVIVAMGLAGFAVGHEREASAGELDKVRKQVRHSKPSAPHRSASRPARPTPHRTSAPARPAAHRATPRHTAPTRVHHGDPHGTPHHAPTHAPRHPTLHYPAPPHAAGHAVLATPQLPTVGRYNRTPYERDADGLVVRVPQADKESVGRLWSAQANAEIGALGKTLWKTGFGLDFDYWRLGLGSDLDWVVEGRFKDAMYLGSTNGRVTLIMRPKLRLRVGGGAQYMIDGRAPGQGSREYAAGPNLTADVEIFPFRPLTLSGRVDYGTLYKAPSGLAQAAVGMVFNGVQIYAGYEVRRVGTLTMRGPAAGVRVWF